MSVISSINLESLGITWDPSWGPEPGVETGCRVWHMTKTMTQAESIMSEMTIRLGRNVMNRKLRLAHVSLTSDGLGSAMLILIGRDAGEEGCLLELEIDPETALEPDPSEEHPDWMVSQEPIKILRVISATPVTARI